MSAAHLLRHSRKLRSLRNVIDCERSGLARYFSTGSGSFAVKENGVEKRIGGARFSQYRQSGNSLETCKVSVGGVNGSSTFRGTLTNRVSSGVTGFNGSLSCGRVASARSFSSSADLPPHQEIGMPSLSPTMTEGNIAKWVKKEGDKVSPGEVLCEVETDKATVEMECMEDGYLAKIVQGDGAKEIKVGDIICVTVEEEGDIEKFKDYKPSSSDAAVAPSESKAKSEPEEPKAEEKVPAKAPEPKAPKTEETSRSGDRIFSSPLARKLAEDNNVPLSSVKGTGPDGRILKADIEDYLASAAKGGKSETFAASGLDYTDIPNAQIRKVTANRLLASKQTIPHYYLTVDTRVDNLIKLRGELNPLQEASGGKKISINDLVIKAAALALRKVPQCNSSWMNDFIRQYNNVNINVAVQTEHGLFVPVVRDADKKGLGTIGEEVKQLAQRARDNSLKPQDYEGGTFTVSNLGGPFGIKQFCAIINPPQSAILAIGSAKGSVCIRRQNGGKSETFAASGLDYTDIPNAQIRKVTANPLLASKQTIPHYYLTVDTRVDNLIKLRGELNPLQEASGLHWEATKGNPKGSKKSLPRQSLRPRGRSMSLAPDIIKKIGREVASSSLKDLVVMKLACKAWGSSLEASVPLLVLSCPTSQRIFFLKIKSNEAGFPIIEETDCLFPPPPGSFLCWGAANGAMALYNSELNKTFLHCQACGYEDVLTEVPANHCPKGVFFREENIKMVIMQLEENITMQMLYLEQFVDDESDESDGEQGAANKEEQPVDDEQLENDIELTWAPYPGAEDLEGFQSVSFAPGMTFIAITRYSVVVIDEISRRMDQNMIQLQVDPTDGEYVVWPFNGCHVFTIEQIAHVCFLLRSSSGESVKAKVYQLQSNGNQSYDFIPVTNLGGNSVYLGGNQVIVLPSADNRSNTIYIEDNDGLQRGFQIFAINLETQVVTTMPFPQDIVGSLTDLTAAVWVSPPCWHCQDTSKSRNSGSAYGGDD